MIVCGGDEAGRGALLGPLVVAVVAVSKSKEKRFSDIGVRDSKLLSPSRRTELYEKIRKISEEVLVDAISAADINEAMGSGISLNELEAVRFSKLFDKINSETSIVYLDSPDVKQEKFGTRVQMHSSKLTRVVGVPQGRRVEKGARATKIVSEHKADAKYPVVSAASIVAKVTRDAEIAQLSSDIGVKLGSGYPSDRYTLDAVRKNINNPMLKPHLREYWATTSNLKQSRMWDYVKSK